MFEKIERLGEGLFSLLVVVMLALALLVLEEYLPLGSSAAGVNPLFYTTLDDSISVSNPVYGTGFGSTLNTSPVNDFIPSYSGNGIRVDTSGEYVRFLQTDGTTKNVELDSGTLDFWYRPNYNHNDGVRYPIVSIGAWGTPGSMHLMKNNASNGNSLTVYVFSSTSTIKTFVIPSSSYGWLAGDLMNMRVTWDFGVAAGVPNMHLYLNSQEKLPSSNTLVGPLAMPQESSTNYIYIGNRDTGTLFSNGVIDDLKIYDYVAPFNTPTPTPAPTVTTSVSSTPVPVTTPTVSPLLKTNLDDLVSVSNPEYGTSSGFSMNTSPADDFVLGKVGNGLRFDGASEYLRYQQTDGSVNNVELDRGTINFWFKPNYNSVSSTKRAIFSTGKWTTPGSMTLVKQNGSNNYGLDLIVYDASGKRRDMRVAKTDYNWLANQWVHFHITWDWTMPSGSQAAHVYINGQDKPLGSASVNFDGSFSDLPWPMPTESQTNHVYIGARTVGDTLFYSGGVIDEFMIYDQVVPLFNYF